MHAAKKSISPAAAPVFVFFLLSSAAFAHGSAGPAMSPTNIFAPASTPARLIFGLSLFVLGITAAIFVMVFSLLSYCVVRFRKRANDDGHEPPQVYGSNQVELAWTVIPVLIVVALFMATARVIANVQRPLPAPNAIEVIAIGHQFTMQILSPSSENSVKAVPAVLNTGARTSS
jgi:cytochrome c oxidase subunit II